VSRLPPVHRHAESRSYPPIGSLGAIGDGYSLALIGPDGGVEWWCPLRFDADPLIWPLLDRERGGVLRVAPVASGTASRREYEAGTAVLLQEWETGGGRLRARMAMAWPQPRGGQQILWELEAVAGDVEVEVVFEPRPEWGGATARLFLRDEGGGCEVGDLHVLVDAPARLAAIGSHLYGRFRLSTNERASVRVHAVRGTHPRTRHHIPGLLEATRAAWDEWVSGIEYAGPAREAVVRSAIALKLLIYEPTGAMVAAATTSLPERIGGVRNWDYRYTWLRDAGFTLNSLYVLGCREEGHAYARWLQEVAATSAPRLSPLYSLDGGTDLAERTVDGIEGYRGSQPVRVGNAAEAQLQLDVYGELLDCVTICEVMGDETMRETWADFRRLVDFVADHWRERDSGIWEVRDRTRHFVHSKAQSWVALDRGYRIAETFGLPGDRERWRSEAGRVRDEVMRRGTAPVGYFVRSYGEGAVDAALLTLPALGFLAGDDPRMLSTIDAVRKQLLREGAIHPALILRYPPEAGDGLPAGEGTFTICGFWLVEALAEAGQREEALELFEGLAQLGGDLGLFAEELDPLTGDHLGNFPQAFTHIGLINAGLRLAAASERPAARAELKSSAERSDR
jgi:hypothetical protein